MAEVVCCDPDDMTAIVDGGRMLATLDAALGAHGQHLPIDPVAPERTTIGSMLGAAHCGPLRCSAGTVRDYLIGVQFVGHGGHLIRAGGRVVKNVAGYDLMKLMVGSFGTLGIITEATFKVRPMPETYAGTISYHDTLEAAFETGFRLYDALPLLYLELLSPGVAAPMAREGSLLLAAGVGGNHKEVDYQLDEIRKFIPDAAVLDGGDERKFYCAVRDLELPAAMVKMQLAVAPRELPSCLDAPGLHFRAHIGSGVAQVAFDGSAAMAADLRRVAADASGNARLLALDPALRGAIAPFNEPAPPAMKLMRAVKGAFDPAGIFNPGCFVGGL
jgi:glycolate oxidase FAD binding subunit